jgi:hypothetical protein
MADLDDDGLYEVGNDGPLIFIRRGDARITLPTTMYRPLVAALIMAYEDARAVEYGQQGFG